jgi:ATP-dependent Clp protease protease subunit
LKVVVDLGSGKGCRAQVTMMPIGTPKVPYRTPNEGGWQWVDIWNVLVCNLGHT